MMGVDLLEPCNAIIAILWILIRSSSCSSTSGGRYDITKKWEESGMSKRKEHNPGRSIKTNPGTPMSILAKKRGSTCRRPLDESVASGTPYTFQKDSVPAHKAKLVQSWLKKNVPNFWDFNTCPNSPDLNYVTTTCRKQCGVLKASIKSEMNKVDPAGFLVRGSGVRLEDIFEAEGGHIEW
ncbi:Transposable element tcb1 transposase [Caligus rogercresseyi]|uniref:Transposable element tcb1 transposase n=1 Tax=Caligus rogercresseyi TaxID=217165 RepID=A0A7T8QSJ8_CALRO|nr:Transposable element tcb1 transposase [Caligus rogercresseyi]